MSTISDKEILATVTLTGACENAKDEKQLVMNVLNALMPGVVGFCFVSWHSGISGVMEYPARMKRPSAEMLIAFYRAAIAAAPGTVGPITYEVSTPDRKVRRKTK
jgi:hypothetical protein